MLVFGDLACPNRELSSALHNALKRSKVFDGHDLLLGNLEGVLVEDGFVDRARKLYNSESVLELFAGKKTVFSLANNHIFDYPDKIGATLATLDKHGIEYVGLAGPGSAHQPLRLRYKGENWVIFGHCWDVMLDISSDKPSDYSINCCSYESLLGAVTKARYQDEDAKVVVYLHWNFDLERLPFPAHRKLARRLIDVGANVVIGSHSHCVNGGELYNGGIIIYGLGNFFIPDGVFFDGRLKYPEYCKIVLVVDIADNIEDSVCYWYKVTSDNGLSFVPIGQELFKDGPILERYSPYRAMTYDEYLRYFKQNRSKSLLVPVWGSYEDTLINGAKDRWITTRIRCLRFAKTVLRMW